MIHKDGQFAGHGGSRLYWQAWLPDTEVRAAVVVAHGYGEHGGRYGNLVEALVPRGFVLYALDHRGHGRSEGPRGHVSRFAQFVADLHSLRVRIEDEQRSKPLFLLGHSMGGLIAVHYLLTHASGMAGAILSSPAFGLVNEPSRPLRWLARVLSWIAPRTSFQANVEPELLSRDPAVVQAYRADPLVHRRATVRFYSELEWAIVTARERAAEIRVPLLVLQAGDDRLVDAQAAESFFADSGAETKQFRSYPECFHELFNELDKQRVFADLERWLEERLQAG